MLVTIPEAIVSGSITALIGLGVFSVTQLVQKFFVEPIKDFDKVSSKIVFTLAVRAAEFGTPSAFTSDQREEAGREIRICAGELAQAVNCIHWYWLARLFRLVPSLKNIKEIYRVLTGLSRTAGDDRTTMLQNNEWLNRVPELLGLRLHP